MTIEVEATETTIPALLENIERGDEVQLKKNGLTIAIVSPTQSANERQRTPEQIAEAHAALQEIRKLAVELKLPPFDLEQFRADRDFGRQ